MNYFILRTILTISLLSFAFHPPVDDEGMFPLSEIRNLDLSEAGLKIPIDEVYNPEGVSLIDALVKVGGCTGSFVSSEGLILTNHHCSFDAVQNASTTEQNYLEDGFLAQTRENEIPASGLTCRITESYEDVSDRILKAADAAGDVSNRQNAISAEIKNIIAAEERENPNIKAEVSEMFIGKSYVLFRYRIINDIRLVYVPPRAIGEFGGETDNWMWPRHTGDFSFLRAYVAPDGSSASFSRNNVPFKPKKHLKVNPDGVKEDDFVFILGYPGRTFRHQPSQYIEYQVRYQLPYVQSMNEWLINLYEEKGENDPEFALEIAPKIKTFANVEKNYRSKLIGIERLDLITRKKSEEADLASYINSRPELKSRHSNLLNEIEKVYEGIFEAGRRQYVYNMLRNVKTYRLAELLIENLDESAKPNDQRKNLYKDESLNSFYGQINNLYSEYYEELDIKILSKIVSDAQSFEETKGLSAFDLNNNSSPAAFAEHAVKNSMLGNREKYLDLLEDSPEKILSLNDPMIKFAREVYLVRLEDESRSEARQGKLNLLLAQYMDVKQEMLNTSFIPDANSTLRLTYGYIKGYSPVDATYYSPVTTLKGLIEKGRDSGDFQLPQIIRKLYNEKDFGRFKDPVLNSVPVGLLYNMDTTGGNSGSPVLNAFGEFIGINFDRAFEATINDYTWSADYSRSIGVDVRYILWFTEKVGGAGYLLKEMGI